MATSLPAKSILKQEPTRPKPTLSDEQKAKAERDRRNLGIALHHANRIQQQKDIEVQILASIETLLDFPVDQVYTSSEASTFASLVQPFQPSDLDSLIEERQSCGKCGYALCSKAPRSITIGSSVTWRLKTKGAEDYCSNGCLRKTLYVKAQLSEVPASEREPGQQPEVMLHEDDRSPAVPSVSSTKPNGTQEQVANGRELAHERGETTASFRPGQVMASTVVEKPRSSHRSPDLVRQMSSSHTNVEGYEPRQGSNQSMVSSQQVENVGAERMTDPASAVNDAEEEAWRDFYSNIDRR